MFRWALVFALLTIVCGQDFLIENWSGSSFINAASGGPTFSGSSDGTVLDEVSVAVDFAPTGAYQVILGNFVGTPDFVGFFNEFTAGPSKKVELTWDGLDNQELVLDVDGLSIDLVQAENNRFLWADMALTITGGDLPMEVSFIVGRTGSATDIAKCVVPLQAGGLATVEPHACYFENAVDGSDVTIPYEPENSNYIYRNVGWIRWQFTGNFDTLTFDANGSPIITDFDDLCGNGNLDASEECDDGNTANDDGCDSNCVLECGNDNLDGDEECDDGNTANDDGCDSNCVLECGNSNLDGDEECDDGNRVSGDGCDSDCQIEIPPECGNGEIEEGEECDDGNTCPRDGCDENCSLERSCQGFGVEHNLQCECHINCDDNTCSTAKKLIFQEAKHVCDKGQCCCNKKHTPARKLCNTLKCTEANGACGCPGADSCRN